MPCSRHLILVLLTSSFFLCVRGSFVAQPRLVTRKQEISTPCLTALTGSHQRRAKAILQANQKQDVYPAQFTKQATSLVKRIRTPNHIGGRRPRRRQQQPPKKDSAIKPWQLIVGALVALWIFFSQLFGGGAGNPSYVYYSSTFYESTVVRPDGKIESSRQESFKSNRPELVPQRQQDRSRASSIIRAEQEEMAREIDSMMQFERQILEDFF